MRPPPKVGERLQLFYEGEGGGWFWGKVLEAEPLKAALLAAEGAGKSQSKPALVRSQPGLRYPGLPWSGELGPLTLTRQVHDGQGGRQANSLGRPARRR